MQLKSTSGEEKLRQSGVPFTVVRPGGLTDKPGGALLQVGEGIALRFYNKLSTKDLVDANTRSERVARNFPAYRSTCA